MIAPPLTPNDVTGFVRPRVDAHTLGLTAITQLLRQCGYATAIADETLCGTLMDIQKPAAQGQWMRWIREAKLTRLSLSYRMDPADAQRYFGRLVYFLRDAGLLAEDGGPITHLYFAGLPPTCQRIQSEYSCAVTVFPGGESPIESLQKMGVPECDIPSQLTSDLAYDEMRMTFGREQITSGAYRTRLPSDRSGYPGFGTKEDRVVSRIAHARSRGITPLTRAHVGPYNPNYSEALKEFNSWLKALAETGFLDIVSIGSSQLSQSDFGTDWGEQPNGGGVPINSKEDLHRIYDASRPMLVRTYSGTRNLPELARVYEETINIAWHAMSFWWFNQIDARGPYTVEENLRQHLATLGVIAESDKPFEPNIPHHFAFRGADDVSYVLAGYLGVRTAKKYGIRDCIVQTMLNTPRQTWGIQDLAKSRALWQLARGMADSSFRVYLQPRAGLDYFSPDLDVAKVQLSAVAALIDDIEPDNPLSPDLVHVVSYCEAVHLATPELINESIQITLESLDEYRRQKAAGQVDRLFDTPEIHHRQQVLMNQVQRIVSILESQYDDLYTPESFYDIFRRGIFPVPYLWIGRDEFSAAVDCETALVDGSVSLIDSDGEAVDPVSRIEALYHS